MSAARPEWLYGALKNELLGNQYIPSFREWAELAAYIRALEYIRDLEVDRDHGTELTLRNVHMAASRAKQLLNGGKQCAVTKTLALLTHIQRFCEEAGYAPSVLRSNAETKEVVNAGDKVSLEGQKA